MAAVFGFAGMRDYDGQLSFRPLQSLRPLRVRFRLAIRSQQIEVEITQKAVSYFLRKGKKLKIRHYDEEINLVSGKRVSRTFEQGVKEEPKALVGQLAKRKKLARKRR